MDNLVINVELSVNDVNMILALMGKTLTESNFYPIMIKMKQQAQAQIDGYSKRLKEDGSI
jgi:hypothetical protein